MNNHPVKKCRATKRVNETQLLLQDELTQWNRLTEEMLYLLIAIIGKLSKVS